MVKNILLLVVGIFFILLSGFVSAIDVPVGGVSFYNLSSFSDLWGSNDATNIGTSNSVSYPTFNISGDSSPNSSDFESSENDFLDTGSTFGFSDGDDMSLSMWFNAESLTGDSTYIGLFTDYTTTTSKGNFLLIYSDGHIAAQSRWLDGATHRVTQITSAVGVITTASWYHIVLITYGNATTHDLWINGEHIAVTNLSSNSPTQSYFSGQNFDIGNYRTNDVVNTFDGLLDEVKVFNRVVNQSEILSLYNYGVVDVPSVSRFELSAKSFWDGVSIVNFSVDVNGSIYNTTNGTIITNFNSSEGFVFNITFFDNEWFNRTYLDYNISGNLEGVLKQTEVNVSFKFSSGDFITTLINLTSVDTGEFFNVSGGNEIFFPNEGFSNFSVRCDNEIFAPFNFTLNLSALDNSTFVFVVNETQTVLTFLDGNTSLPIGGANITIYYPSGANISRVTNSSGMVNFSYIFNNSLEFGNYMFNFDKIGYFILNISESINLGDVPFSKIYNVSKASIIINVFDRETGNLLVGTNVTIAFIGLFNESTNTGVLVKDNLSIVSGEYIIYAGNENYKTETRTFTFTNQEILNINFYLLNLTISNIGVLEVNTLDSYYRKIIGAKVELLEYDEDTKSYISVSECITNVNAQCFFNVELNNKIYYLNSNVIINNVLLSASTSISGEIFVASGESRNLIFYTRTDFNVEPSSRLLYDVSESFVNNVSSISVDFYSLDGGAYTVCIEYFQELANGYVSVTGDLYCLTSSSAVQNIDTAVTLNRSNIYKAEVYIMNGASDINLRTFFYDDDESFQEIFSIILSSLIIILWIVLLAFSLYSKNIMIFFVGGLILTWLQMFIFPFLSMMSFAVFRTIILVFGILVARKKRDFR